MRIFFKKNGITIVIIAYLALVGLFFYFVIIPLNNKILGKASDIEQEKIDQDITKKKIVTVPVIEKDYQKYKDNEENLDVIIDQSQEVGLIKELEGMAEGTRNKIEFKIQENNIKVPSSKKAVVVDIKGKLVYTNFLSMQIALEGDYQGFLDFLHKLENYKDYINVISIRSEKIFLDKETGKQVSPNSSSSVSPDGKNDDSKKVLSSILDIVVYIKK
jgi:hypothetical protein